MALYFLIYQDAVQGFRESNVFRTLGAYSYSIYMMQFPCFYYYKKAIAVGLLSWASPQMMVLLGMGMCIVVGSIVHYVIELPVGTFLEKQLKRLQANEV